MGNCYPISLNLTGKRCLVVGGGQVAERKVRALLRCGALIYVVSPELSPRLEKMVQQGLITYRKGPYHSKDLEGVFLVISATDREEVNRKVADDCAGRNLLVNIVDDPLKGNFFVPAVVRRGSLTIAISTDGKSPMYARKIKEELENIFGEQYGEFLEILGRIREEIIRNEVDEEQKRNILEKLVGDEVLGFLRKNRLDQAKERVYNAYRGSRTQSPNSPGRG